MELHDCVRRLTADIISAALSVFGSIGLFIITFPTVKLVLECVEAIVPFVVAEVDVAVADVVGKVVGYCLLSLCDMPFSRIDDKLLT